MNLESIDIDKLVKLITEQIENITCFDCLRYYVVPTTATCGHTLCSTCWRKKCPFCQSEVEKKTLKINVPIQILTIHVTTLKKEFEDFFEIKLDEYTYKNLNVKEWLGNSQNRFSASLSCNEQCTQNTIKSNSFKVTSDVHVHTKKLKTKETKKEIVQLNVKQDDWDKIEVMEEEHINNFEERIVATADIEKLGSTMVDNDCTEKNPRRSLRNKDTQSSIPSKVIQTLSYDKENGQDNINLNNKPNKLCQNWNNVKKMKKEFSKLNKVNKSKLNVSIEMCKKTNEDKKCHKSSQVINNVQETTYENNTGEATLVLKDKNIIVPVKGTSNEHPKSILNDNPKSKPLNEHTNVSVSVVNNVKNNFIQEKNNESTLKNAINNEQYKVKFFKQGSLHTNFVKDKSFDIKNKNTINQNNNAVTIDNENIEITIKIGNTLTNICIKKKENDVQLKINSDREVQTSLGTPNIETKSIEARHSIENSKEKVQTNNGKNKKFKSTQNIPDVIAQKSLSTKQNTYSADTSTVQPDITESIEKELVQHIDIFPNGNDKNKETLISLNENNKLNVMDNVETASNKSNNIPEDMEFLNDVDIFEAEFVKEGSLHNLKSAGHTPSEILIPTFRSKISSQKTGKRRGDDIEDEDSSFKKKVKVTQENIGCKERSKEILLKDNIAGEDSENINYDAIMSQVFANINADMEESNKTDNVTLRRSQTSIKNKSDFNTSQDINNTIIKRNFDDVQQKCSENVFSIIEKEELSELFKTTNKPLLTQLENKLSTIVENESSYMAQTKDKVSSQDNDEDIVIQSTPMQDDDDKSVVEDTPQKNISYIKSKHESTNFSDITTNARSFIAKNDKTATNEGNSKQDVVNITDSLDETNINDKGKTIIQKRDTDTPLSISKFVGELTIKSTPLAKKTLDFTSHKLRDDHEETVCSITPATETTQERELIRKAFEMNTPSQIINRRSRLKSVCIAGSCLTSLEQMTLQKLCLQKKWSYVDKYTNDLTHLVVGIDEENKSQRSVKYVCALAASKWIVSFSWVEKCIQINDIAEEEPFEALDWTGEPGPRRSRLAKRKLFQGITFYCMPPFTILDVETLKAILEVSGGRVVDKIQEVTVTEAPAMLLAEPEHTQEDRFMYLAMKLSIVPVNYEWILNCLGSYTLIPIYELLLCPDTLLPIATTKWPPELISRYYD